MPVELARPEWGLPPLDVAECGAYGDFPRLGDAEKQAVWDAYRAGHAPRVPVTLGMNSRVFVLDPRFDAEGLTYERIFHDPQALLTAQLRWQYILRRRHHLFCDSPTELPAVWTVGIDFQNVYEAEFFGAPLAFRTDNVPDTHPWLNDDNKRAIFEIDIERPMERGLFRRGLELCAYLRDYVADKTFLGRPIAVAPYLPGSDGPLTVAMNVRGMALLTDLRRDPEYVRELFDFIVTAALVRTRVFRAHWKLPEPEQVWLADDSIALLGPAQYRAQVLPHHQKWYEAQDPQRTRPRGMHLCGDATRHFTTLRDACGVTMFDTGFPVDFGALRQALGPEVELSGGVEVPLLLSGSPQDVYARALAILKSGVRAGGRFVLREANNLPPGVAWANLAAMYRAAFDAGHDS
jgi:hypothetical protein